MVNRMNSSFPNRWSFSYLKFTKYVTHIIAEPKYKYRQQEQVTVRNHNRNTALEWSVLKYWGGGGLKQFYKQTKDFEAPNNIINVCYMYNVDAFNDIRDVLTSETTQYCQFDASAALLNVFC